MLRKSKLGLMEASGCLGHGLELFCLGFVGGVLGLCEVDGKADARRERISAWAGTPLGDTAMVPEGGEKGGRQRERISARARTPSGDTTKVP